MTLYNTTIDHVFDLDRARSITVTLYARDHYHDNSTLVRFIVPVRLNQTSAGKVTLLNTLINKCDRHQTSIMVFYSACVRQAVAAMGRILDGIWLMLGTRLRIRPRPYY